MAQGLNFHRNTFLEKEELNVFQSLLKKSSFINVLAIASESYGIISDEKPSNKYLVTTAGTNAGTIDISGGLILDPNFDLIEISDLKNIPISADSAWYWGKFAYQKVNYEDCLLSIDTNGKVTISSGTINFLEKLRGATTKVPVYVRFVRSDSGTLLNDNVYEVSSVEETYFNLSTYFDFYAESNLRMIILGSIPLGESFSAEQLEGLYSYNNYILTFVPEVTVGMAPAKNTGEYYVNRVMNDGSTVTIQDKRSEYWSLNQNSDEIAALQAQDIALGNKIFYDYIVDSDAALAGLINNPNAHTVLIKNGTWNYDFGSSVENVIILHSNTKIIHCQPNAILNITGSVSARNSDTTQSMIIYNPTTSNDEIKEIKGLNINITLRDTPISNTNCYTYGFNNLKNLYDCNILIFVSADTTARGYLRCKNLCNCNSTATVVNCYSSCENLKRCTGKALSICFYQCNNLEECYVIGTKTTAGFGFSACNNLNKCSVELTSETNSGGTFAGFYSCKRLVNCYAKLMQTISFSQSPTCFESCTQINNCYAYSDSSKNNQVTGFKFCNQVIACLVEDNIPTKYSDSFASFADTTGNECADTAVGGFNK